MNDLIFIENVALFVRKYAPLYGICVHSPVIAGAVLESDFGRSYKATFGHNYHGLKYRKNRVPIAIGKFTDTSKEDRGDHDEEIIDEWFKFASMEEGIVGYFQFINTANYANLKGVTDPRTYVENLVSDKFATDKYYVEKIMDIIEKYDLTKYDNAEVKRMYHVFLSAGHGGSDPGATAFGLKEKNINLNTLIACKEVLERHGVKVSCSRTTDVYDPVAQETNEANASGADLAVSFHANAGGGDGFEAFYFSSSKDGKKLALLGEKYVNELGQNSRGIKFGNHLHFVKKTKMTAVLFESFFVDNDKDNDIGDTIAEQKAFGTAYAKAILEYFGIEYRSTTGSGTAVDSKIDKIYKVQCGAFLYKANAEALDQKLKAAGYNSYIVEETPSK